MPEIVELVLEDPNTARPRAIRRAIRLNESKRNIVDRTKRGIRQASRLVSSLSDNISMENKDVLMLGRQGAKVTLLDHASGIAGHNRPR